MTARRTSAPLPVTALHRSLLRWYRREKRPFLWRDSDNPYLVPTSEFMLQQTQASRVQQLLPAWYLRFPTLGSLAAATPREVLLAWAGFGYNRRALHLQRAARQIVSRHGGRIPKDPVELRTLPGVGKYTAHAIA